jgi:hypothetical protein
MSAAGRTALSFSLVALASLISGNLWGHVLDQYLQATRISVESNRVILDMDLTPGVEVADNILQTIDLDHDGKVSPDEAAAYVKLVLDSVSLEIDGQRYVPKLQEYRWPDVTEVRRGEGIIRLRATSATQSAGPGQHRLSFSNTHRSDIGEYLVNATVPDDRNIRITGQSRDEHQRQFTLDYTISSHEKTTSIRAAIFPMLGLVLAVAMIALVRRSQYKPQSQRWIKNVRPRAD